MHETRFRKSGAYIVKSGSSRCCAPPPYVGPPLPPVVTTESDLRLARAVIAYKRTETALMSEGDA